MNDFLLELRCEEIPARMQAGARAELERLFRREMEAVGLSLGVLTVWSTPRRLVLIARGLPQATEAVSEEAKGPPVGAPDAAVDGFCSKNGIARDKLEVRDVKGRETYFAVIERPGRATKDVLAAIIPTIIQSFVWPKSMRWGAASISTESLRWVRPLSGIVAILGDELVECSVDGIASGYATHGHRFHCRGASQGKVGTGFPDRDATIKEGEITIGGAADYQEKLRACHVIVDHEERAALIREGARKAAADAGLVLVEDEGLVIENAGLTEWPVPLLGRFDEAFLNVPPEVIQLTARVNQKYFVCESPLPPAGGDGGGPEHGETPTPNPSRKREGNLANAFVCTANITPVDPAVVVDGNRKVLAARLSDARFFWEQDRKTTLAEHAQKLERITFHEKLGTVADKVERVAKLARWLCEEGIVADTPLPTGEGPGVGGATSDQASNTYPQPLPSREGAFLADLAEQAARLCKADLVTEMVGEFPELQGLMGGYYARAEGLPDEVADAIRDHYKPVGQGDEVPTAPVTVAVSLADKLDTLAGFFSQEMKPTGSKDPFALRRSAIGILDILVQNDIRVGSTFDAAISNLAWNFFHRAEIIDPKLVRFALNNGNRNGLEGRINEANMISRGGVDGVPVALDFNLIARDLLVVSGAIAEKKDGLKADILDFLADRLKVQQREAGVRHDLIDAVFALGGEDDLVRLLARVNALQSFMETEDGANLLAGYKRAANILKKEGYNPPQAGEGDHAQHGGGARADGSPPSDASRLPPPRIGEDISLSYTPEPAEAALIDALDAAEPKAAQAIDAEDFTAAMAALASLRAPIDRFFDEVTVNADEENKRAARLDLLARFRAAVHNVADFSQIEG